MQQTRPCEACGALDAPTSARYPTQSGGSVSPRLQLDSSPQDLLDGSGMGSQGRADDRAAARAASARLPADLLRKRRRTDHFARHGEPGARERAALATLDKFSRGVFLLDPGGAVTFANRSAEAMVAREDGLLLRKCRLKFKCESTQAALESFLAQTTDNVGESLVLCTPASPKSYSYRVLVSPLEHGAGYCVFVYEPNGGQKPLPVSMLRRMYRLTPAEAHLANELFAGKTLAQAAQTRNISINTAKYMLKAIFSKCEVRSRAELMLLLSLGPRTL